jgi:hypothetical protein
MPKRNPSKQRSCAARALRSPALRQHVVPSKRLYKRNRRDNARQTDIERPESRGAASACAAHNRPPREAINPAFHPVVDG